MRLGIIYSLRLNKKRVSSTLHIIKQFKVQAIRGFSFIQGTTKNILIILLKRLVI